MSRRRARLVVAGLGRIGRLHARNLAGRVPSAELVGVVDPVPQLARKVGDLHGVEWHTSLEDVVGDPEVNGVVIAAPTGSHASLLSLAAAAGKHVFCEKPLGFEVEVVRRAVASVRAAGVELQVGFQRRFDPAWLALHAALTVGELGELDLFRSSHRNAHGPEASDSLGDVFVDVAIHDLDTARWLGGEVAELFAFARGADVASITLRFESGALGLIDVSRAAGYGFECSAELVGSRATAQTGYANRLRGVELLRDGGASAQLARDHAERHEAAYVRELDEFGELVVGRGGLVGAAGDDAIAALELALLAARSAATGQPLAVGAPVAIADRVS